MMNETYKLSGEAEIYGKIAFVEQEPFILSGTVMDNILFGKKLDISKFNQVVKVC